MNEAKNETGTEKTDSRKKLLGSLYDLFEIFGFMTAAVMLVFAFFIRLNVVDGSSMNKTLTDGDYLAVADCFYRPEPGDIVIVHKIDADPYDRPIVKRVIAVGGQTVDIDFDTWTLFVDGEVVEESYRWVNPEKKLIRCEYPLPVTLGENEVFVMGDNRNGSADSRQEEIGPVDVRCVAGKALARLSPRLELFENPFE
ncbi:MAG: signal peptidase I [Ruminococcaceae bacterium]|jgi:signal peptidase I|nr:signal peptidase I [Oscillospiraceae bacterium]